MTMIIVVLILSLVSTIAIYLSSSYSFAQHTEGESGISSLEEQLEVAKSKVFVKGNETAEKEKNEIPKYKWKTCSEPTLGFSIEYPSQWIDYLEYYKLYTSIEKEVREILDKEYFTKIEYNYSEPSYSCVFQYIPKDYGNSTQQIREKLKEFTKEGYGYFDHRRIPLVFQVFTEYAKDESIIKVSTRLSALMLLILDMI